MVNKTKQNCKRVPGAGEVEKERFQQSASTHSGARGKETLNINVVGNKSPKKNSCWWIASAVF